MCSVGVGRNSLTAPHVIAGAAQRRTRNPAFRVRLRFSLRTGKNKKFRHFGFSHFGISAFDFKALLFHTRFACGRITGK
jgi:hypothetical protein